jgi:hypothetical protein
VDVGPYEHEWWCGDSGWGFLGIGIDYWKSSLYNLIERLFGIVVMEGVMNLNENELELIALIRENDKPEKVAAFMIALCLEYLQEKGQERGDASPSGSS